MPGTVVREAYGEEVVYERHRHRYEVNNRYRRRLEEAGLVLLGHLARRPARRVHRAAARRCTRSSSRRRRTPSSRAAPTGRTRCSPRSCAAARGPGRGPRAAAAARSPSRSTLATTLRRAWCRRPCRDGLPRRRARTVAARAGSSTLVEATVEGAGRRDVHPRSSCAIPARSSSCRSTDDGARAARAPVPRRGRRRAARGPGGQARRRRRAARGDRAPRARRGDRLPSRAGW